MASPKPSNRAVTAKHLVQAGKGAAKIAFYHEKPEAPRQIGDRFTSSTGVVAEVDDRGTPLPVIEGFWP